MKRILSTVLILLQLLALSAFANAAAPRIVDSAGLLNDSEIAILETRAQQLVETYEMDVVIVTTESLEQTSSEAFADDYYDHMGYGEDGVLFLLAMTERDWYISTSGNMIYALTDYGISQISEGSVAYFAEGNWYDGFRFFLDSLPAYLEALEQGAPIDGHADASGDFYHGDQEEILYYGEEFSPNFFLSLICGMAVSGIVVFIMRLCMNTKRPKRSAGEYLVDGSWNLTQHRDLFLYSNVSKVRKQDPPKNSGGGSSVHRSSSGRRHGGGGGKF